MTTTTATIRVATLDDASALTAFGERTFRETFGPHNRAEDMDAYCAATYAVEQQRRELEDPDRLTLFAERSGELAGYAHLRAGPAYACVTGPDPIELLRFYVDRPWHGRGLARTLLDAAVAAAEQRGARSLYLAVWEQNLRAIAFYAREGFREIGGKRMLLGIDEQTDRVMTLPLPRAPRCSRMSSPDDTRIALRDGLSGRRGVSSIGPSVARSRRAGRGGGQRHLGRDEIVDADHDDGNLLPLADLSPRGSGECFGEVRTARLCNHEASGVSMASSQDEPEEIDAQGRMCPVPSMRRRE